MITFQYDSILREIPSIKKSSQFSSINYHLFHLQKKKENIATFQYHSTSGKSTIILKKKAPNLDNIPIPFVKKNTIIKKYFKKKRSDVPTSFYLKKVKKKKKDQRIERYIYIIIKNFHIFTDKR